MLLVVLGILAGMLTTVTGFGGGLLLIAALSVVWEPLTALTVTCMALLASNVHRLFLFRGHVRWPVALLFMAGVVPGSLGGALLAVSVPADILRVAILFMAALAAVRVLAGWSWRLPGRALVPSGVGVGFIGATAGGVGPLVGPLLLSTGLQGSAYIATLSAGAVALHVARLVGYGLGGLLSASTVGMAALLAVSLMAGNWLGRTCRGLLGEAGLRYAECLAPLACAVLAGLGLRL